jgi:hypothetical protein
MTFVPEDELHNRLAPVRVLEESDRELYRIVRDEATGEHYLHFAIRHLNVAAGGVEETFHHLLPLSHDDVIALALGDPAYRYPDAWQRPYLRNGPAGGYVWYDPAGAGEDEAATYERIAVQLRDKLLAFHREGRGGETEVRRLMEDIDRLFPPDGP